MAEGMPIKAIAVATRTTPADVEASIERLFVKLAEGLEQGEAAAVARLRVLHRAISDREEQGEQLVRLLPGGVAEKLVGAGRQPGETDTLEVTVLMSDIRGYSAIAERTDPTALAGQLNEHRAAMNRAVIDNDGTVMQFVGDAVMAVFGAPEPIDDHCGRAVAAAGAMHEAQDGINARWEAEGLDGFGLDDDIEMTEIPVAVIAEAAAEVLQADADALFISCTAIRAAATVDGLEARLGVPVVTSNQALVFAGNIARILGIE